MRGESGIIISKRGRHRLGSQKGVKGRHPVLGMCKLEVIFKHMTVNVILKLKYMLCRWLNWLPKDAVHLFMSSDGIHGNYHFRVIQNHSHTEKSVKSNAHFE